MAHGRGKSGLQHPLGWISIDVANVRGLVSATKLGGPIRRQSGSGVAAPAIALAWRIGQLLWIAIDSA